MAGKFRMKEFQGHMVAMQKCIDDFYASIDAQADTPDADAQDNPPPTPGTPRAPTAQDSAPSLDTRTGRKLTHVRHSPGLAALESQIPALTRLRGKF